MFDELPEGQTNFDPEAEAKARWQNQLRDYFETRIPVGNAWICGMIRIVEGVLKDERQKIHDDLIAVADEYELEILRVEVECYFKQGEFKK